MPKRKKLTLKRKQALDKKYGPNWRERIDAKRLAEELAKVGMGEK